MIDLSARRLVPLAAALLPLACGPPPVPVEDGPRAGGRATAPAPPPLTSDQEQAGLPPGHPPLDGGAPHPPMDRPMTLGTQGTAAAAGPTTFEGMVRLEGALARREDGFVFMSVKPAGTMMPSYSRRYSFAEAVTGADGARTLSFRLGPEHTMGGLVPGAANVVEAWFDPDGNVDSKEGGLRVQVPVPETTGATAAGIELVLDPSD